MVKTVWAVNVDLTTVVVRMSFSRLISGSGDASDGIAAERSDGMVAQRVLAPLSAW